MNKWTDEQVEAYLSAFIGNIKARYPHKLAKIDLRFLLYVASKEIMKVGYTNYNDFLLMVNNALIFCASDSILRSSRNITWDILIELKTNKPFLGIDTRKR